MSECVRWTLSFGDDDEAIDVYTANSHEADRFLDRLMTHSDLDLATVGTLPALPARLGPRGEAREEPDGTPCP